MIREEFNITLFEFINMIQKLGFHMTENYQPTGLSKLEYSILEQLYYKENQSLKDLILLFQISESTMRRHLNNFLKNELITRYQPPANKRKWLYNITKEGKTLLDACYFEILQNASQKFEHLDEETLENTIACMAYMRKILSMESR
ncbi:MAG: MarR family transcriptional regulator [Clostridia bacterium]|nr:MarR family transcriptional regulator [Clostridia bacterium]